MHCTQCGLLASPDAKFCSKCGSPIGAFATPTAVTLEPTPTKKLSVFWLYLVGLLLVGAYAAVFIPAAAGKEINPQAGTGTFFWTALFFYLLWKRLGRKGWHGTLIGLAVGFFVAFVAAFISASVRHGSGG